MTISERIDVNSTPWIGFLITISLAGLLIWGGYRRTRKNFGKRRIRPRPLVLRGLMLLIAAIVLMALPRTSAPLLGLAASLGAVLGAYGLKLTTFEHSERGIFYQPNNYIGMVVTALLLARMLYRLLRLTVMREWGSGRGIGLRIDPESTFGQYGVSVTLLMLFVLAGYFVVYNTGVLVRRRTLRQSPSGSPA